MDAHVGRTEWTDPAEVTDLVLALVSGELDAWSGRFVRAGIDTVASLRARAEAGLAPDERTLALVLGRPRPPHLTRVTTFSPDPGSFTFAPHQWCCEAEGCRTGRESCGGASSRGDA